MKAVDIWVFIGLTSSLLSIGYGIKGVINKKQIDNFANYIISIGQIVCGLALLLSLIVLTLKKIGYI